LWVAPRATQASVCTTLGLPSCCWCSIGCSWTLAPGTPVNTRVVITTSDAACCSCCRPCDPPCPQSGTCTVSNTATYTLTTNIGGSANVDGIGITIGLGQNWQTAMTAGCTQSANCTKCNKGHCDGGYNKTTTNYTYTETCWVTGNVY